MSEHYKTGTIEIMDVIEAYELNFGRGNALKYIARAGRKKTEAEERDLKKALNYLFKEVYGVWFDEWRYKFEFKEEI